MVVDSLEAVEGLPENEVAHQIEGRPVVPHRHIHRPPPAIAFLPQSLHQQVHVLFDHGLLLAHGAVGEAVGQRAPQALVLLGVGVEDGAWQAADGARKQRRLGHLAQAALAAGAVPVDVLPRLRVSKGEVVWANAHNGAVVVVQPLCVEGLLTARVADCPWQARHTVHKRTGEVSEGVEVDVVHDRGDLPDDYLCCTDTVRSVASRPRQTHRAQGNHSI